MSYTLEVVNERGDIFDVDTALKEQRPQVDLANNFALRSIRVDLESALFVSRIDIWIKYLD